MCPLCTALGALGVLCVLCMCVCCVCEYMPYLCYRIAILPRLVVEAFGSLLLYYHAVVVINAINNYLILLLVSSILLLLLSNYNFLGIGQVPFIEIVEVAHPPYRCIQWKEPSFISADVTDLTYNVSLSGADQTTLNTTTNETSDCPTITPCQEFNITVTPFSPSLGYVGASNSTTDYIDGGMVLLRNTTSSK